MNTTACADDVSDYTDVLVIGGGPAGAWAAIAAASRGASVRLYDKGFCGTSGATAPSGNSVWYVPDNKEKRDYAKASRYDMGGKLAEPQWMDRVLEQTWRNIHQLKEWGYPFPVDEAGELRGESLQGPEYMRIMRKIAKSSGVKIHDHSPALQLLVDEHGQVSGASGIHRQKNTHWSVRAGAVVLATGGCAFLSNALGCNVLTGDGYLLGAEVGAEFSGMEFSNAYGLGPAFSSVTKSLFYNWATFYDEAGQPIEGAGSSRGRVIIAQHLQTGKVFGQLDKADQAIQDWMRTAQPNFFLPFDRLGINPFTDKFEVTLRLEGTVRGTGGLNILSEDCATSVAGLYAAGDAATRELICGGFTGGGSHNAAWAMSSGLWSGQGAARFAVLQNHARTKSVFSTGTVGISTDDAGDRSGYSTTAEQKYATQAPTLVAEYAIEQVQQQVWPYDKNWFRDEPTLQHSLTELDGLWRQLRHGSQVDDPQQLLRTREAAAMALTARLMYRSAQQRTETRGMARRRDFTALDEQQRYRLISQGLDRISLRKQPVNDGRGANSSAANNTAQQAPQSAFQETQRLAA